MKVLYILYLNSSNGPKRSPAASIDYRAFSKALFQWQDQEKCSIMGRVRVAHTAENTSSLWTVPFLPAHRIHLWGLFFVVWFVFFFLQYLVIRPFFFPLYQENVAAFTPEEPAGWQASETEGQFKCSAAFRCRKQIPLPLFPLSPEVFNTWLDPVRTRLT